MRKQLILLCVLLGIISAGITYYQSLQMTHLVDYAYQVEIAYRIFSGQMPYRDFMLVLTPGLYILMALVMTVTRGYTHYGVIFQSIFTQACVVMVSFLLFYRILKQIKFAFLFSVPLLFVGHAIYPFPVYDVLAVLGMMLFFLLILDRHINRSYMGSFLLGIAITLPLYVKQNIGFIFLLLSFVVALVAIGIHRKRIHIRHVAVFFLGFFLSVGAFVFWLFSQHSFSDFLYQTLMFPNMARDPGSTVNIILKDYFSVWRFVSDYITSFMLFIIGSMLGYILLCKRYMRTRPHVIRIYEIFLLSFLSLMMIYLVNFFITNDVVDGKLALTFFWGVTFALSLIIGIIAALFCIGKKRAFPKHIYIPVMVVLICHVGFLSQSVAGSHYGMWPLLLLLMVWTISLIQPFIPLRIIAGISIVWIASITVYLFWYSMTNQFVGYVDMSGPVYRSKMAPLQGLSAPGPWIPAFETLLTEVENIPHEDTMAFLPGDDVFFAATGRIPTLRCSQWNVGTCDVFGFDLVDEIREKDIDWIIVKEPVMTGFAYPVVSWIPINLDYEWYKDVEGIYTIYKKK
jgi:hypothetical protein